MKKSSIDFIESVINREESLYKDGFEDSIMSNEFGRNLFLEFESKELVREYLINLCNS